MKYGKYAIPHWALRLGVSITFLWIGIDIIRNPEVWIGYVPSEVPLGFSREGALKLGGFADITLGLLLLFQVWAKLASFLIIVHLIGIIATNGIDAVVIRDVAILGAAFALLTWPGYYSRSKWKKMFSKKKKKDSGGEE